MKSLDQKDFGEQLEEVRPKAPANTGALRSSVSSGMRAEWPQVGEKMVVIQDDEGLVKRTVVDRMTEVQAEIDWWQERLLWSAAHMPDFEKTRRYIEEIEAELEDLRPKRDLGEDLEDLT